MYLKDAKVVHALWQVGSALARRWLVTVAGSGQTTLASDVSFEDALR
jgi:hypothetical protein